MVSGTGCAPGPGERLSAPGVVRDASASRRDQAPLRRADDFKRVLSSGSRVRRGGVTIVKSPGTGSETRIGLVVGRRVGNAVARNRAKRRLRHALAATPLEQGMDYVIIADRQVVDVSFTRLCDWLERAIRGER